MGPLNVVMFSIFRTEMIEVGFTEDNEMVETFLL